MALWGPKLHYRTALHKGAETMYLFPCLGAYVQARWIETGNEKERERERGREIEGERGKEREDREGG